MLTTAVITWCLRFVAWLASSLLIAALVLEGIVRFFAWAPPLSKQYQIFEPDALLPFKLRPNFSFTEISAGQEFSYPVRHNSLGFRGTEFSISRSEQQSRTVVIGDSFTYGVGADDTQTYPAQLEQKLLASGNRIEVLNLGIPRYFPAAEALLAEQWIPQLKPDVAIVAFTMNDLRESLQGLSAVVLDSRGFLKQREALRWGELGVQLQLHSALFRLLWISVVARPLWLGPHLKPWVSESELEQAMPIVLDNYRKMKKVADQHSARMILLFIPPRPKWDEMLTPTVQKLQAWAVAEQVSFVDASQTMHDESLYWKKDGHCNPAGYSHIADALINSGKM